MRLPTDDVTDTELAMLQVFWERGEATRRRVANAPHPVGGESHHTTVQKRLERLEKKGFVRAERREGVRLIQAN